MSFILHNKRQSGFHLSDSLEHILDTAIERNELHTLVLLVPTGRRVRLLKRYAVTTAYKRRGTPVADLQIFTLEQFVRLCAAKLLGARVPRIVTDGYISALMEEAAEKATKNGTLKFFTSAGQDISPSVLERLQSIILGLKEDGITPTSLRDDLEQGGEEVVDAARLGDIAALYEAYQKELGEKLCDYPGLLNHVVAYLQAKLPNQGQSDPQDQTPLETQWRTLFPEVQMLLLEGFTEFKKPEEQFLAALYHAPFHVRVVVDYSPANGPLFGGLDETLENLQGLRNLPLTLNDPQMPHFSAYSTDSDANERYKYQRERHQPLISYLRRWLFNTTDDIRHDGFTPFVNIIGFENRADEVRSITKLIKHLALNDHIPLSEICVVTRQPEHYTGLFREMTALYDIPANITDRSPLEKSPVVTAIYAALDVILLGFRREDVLRALQSPYLRFERREGKRPQQRTVRLDAANLHTTAERLRISGGNRYGRGGRERWTRRLNSRLEFLKRREHALAEDSNADTDERRETSTFLAETERAVKDFMALAAILPEAELRLSPEEFARFVKDQILVKLGIRDSILAFDKEVKKQKMAMTDERLTDFLRLEEEVERDARALTAFVELLDEMASIMAERFGTRKRPLTEYVERLRTASRTTRFQVREKLGYGVTVTSLEQIRGVPFRVTILCGAVDGEFPGRYVPKSFLGKELSGSEERFLKHERIQFFQSLTNSPEAFENGSKRLFITYPIAQGDAELVRSSFVDALLKVTSLAQSDCLWDIRTVRAKKRTEQHQADSPISWIDAVAGAIASEDELLRVAAVAYCEAARNGNSSNDVFTGFAEYSAKQTAEQTAASTSKQYEHYNREAARAQAYLQKQLANSIANNDEPIAALVSVPVDAPESTPTFSISRLEQYHKCPYQYFAQQTLHLREVQEFDSSLSPLESGSLLHKILYRFYRELQENSNVNNADDDLPHDILRIKALKDDVPDIVMVRLHGDREGEYRERLRVIAEAEIENIRFEHPFFELDKEDLLGGGDKRGKLDRWLESEVARSVEGWSFAPALFEFAFGERTSKTNSGAISSVALAENLHLRGKIDRIELWREADSGSGESDGIWRFMIADYKSGNASNLPGNNDIKKGAALQMPLYAEAARKLLLELYGIDAEPAGMVYYVLSPKADKKTGKMNTEQFVLLPKDSPIAALRGLTERSTAQVVKGEEEMENAIRQSVNFAEQYAGNITRGEFPIKPLNEGNSKPCKHCSYNGVCRIAELPDR